MYTRYFGLQENPFALSPDPRYLFLSRRHQEALAHLEFGMTQAGGFVQLTGEVGTGKTLMIKSLLERLPESVDVALILYPFLSTREFVAAICDDLRVPHAADESLKGLIEALNRYLLDNHAKGRRTVLIIDEAQKLSRDVLEQVRLLTNLETRQEKLLQILLIGQPELVQLLAQRDLRQLAQRVTARYSLEPLSARETRDYIQHRLRVAGAADGLFTRAAMRTAHRLAHGTPRLVNVICDRALLGAYAAGKPQVTSAIVYRAAREIGRVAPRRWWPALTAAAAVSVIALAGWWWFKVAPTPASMPVAAVEKPAAAAPVASAQVQPVALAAASKPTLAAVLRQAGLAADTHSAFTQLFARWQLNYDEIEGDTACARAEEAGLRCLLVTGTWNNLRLYDRPAVLELADAQGNRYHTVLARLENDRALLSFGAQTHEFKLAELDGYWFGKAMVLWRPPIEGAVLQRGARGADVQWLREALARQGFVSANLGSELFDADLERQVIAFQRRHQILTDGKVGERTQIYLKSDDPSLSSVVTAAGG